MHRNLGLAVVAVLAAAALLGSAASAARPDGAQRAAGFERERQPHDVVVG